MRATLAIALLGSAVLAACAPPDQNRFRPLLETDRVAATRSADPFVDTFLRVCLDPFGRSSAHKAAAQAAGLTKIGNLGGESFVANDPADTQAMSLIAQPAQFRCALDDLTAQRGATTLRAFADAMSAAGATSAGANRYRIAARPTLGSGDTIGYDVRAVPAADGLSLVIGNAL